MIPKSAFIIFGSGAFHLTDEGRFLIIRREETR